ncbi:MAG: methylmalonyl-CoA carboxyltransferase [Clostridia bacterium]|nr:methylmalonyl-CoA carboxyltransferase [Clostridia bacterium]
MDNLSKVTKLLSEKETAVSGGGKDKIAQQHKAGKKTARERVAMLFDEGTFVETDTFLKNRNPLSGSSNYADGVVAGYGTVDGRLVYCYSQDYSVLSGTLGEMNAKKIVKIYDLALKTGAPVVAMLDCGGVRLEEGLDAISAFGEIVAKASKLSGTVPQIAMVLGPCAGTMTVIPAVSDFAVMVDETASLYVNCKEVIKKETEKSCDLFPGAEFSAKNGTVNLRAANEDEAFVSVKKLLSYLPSNYLEDTYSEAPTDDINRATPDIAGIIPNDEKSGFNMADIIKSVADNCEFFEISEEFAKNMLTGFVKLNGQTVGVVANQPCEEDGIIDSMGAKKAASFVGICDSFNIPILTFTDSAGYKISLDEEKWGLVNSIGKLGMAFASADVPKVNVIVRKAYGGAYALMNSKQLGADFSYAFPTAVISAATPEITMEMLHNDEIKKAVKPQEKRLEVLENIKEGEASAYAAAMRGFIDDIINPADVRPVVVSAFDVLLTKRVDKAEKKHGNLPM